MSENVDRSRYEGLRALPPKEKRQRLAMGVASVAQDLRTARSFANREWLVFALEGAHLDWRLQELLNDMSTLYALSDLQELADLPSPPELNSTTLLSLAQSLAPGEETHLQAQVAVARRTALAWLERVESALVEAEKSAGRASVAEAGVALRTKG